MSMNIFVTGATGFVGQHLLAHLAQQGHRITALLHAASSTTPLPPGVASLNSDLLDADALQTAVAQTQPNLIYHLAGQAYPAKSWHIPGQTLAVNSVGTANLLQAAAAYGRSRVIVVTSADVYDLNQPTNLPITEETLTKPGSPYGVSKLAAAQLVPLFHRRFGLDVIEARPFNHIGPGQNLGFVVPDFASQVAAIKQGKQPNRMLVGNLDVARDFTDVRDVVRAYTALAENGRAGQSYLIASGQAVSIRHILNTLTELAGVTVHIEQDPARTRPSDVPCLYASYAKLQQDTGWEPTIPLRQSLADVLGEWLAR